jgi:hypothetical protein
MKVNCAPDEGGWAFEMTPVDLLVKSIVLFAGSKAHFGKVYNVVQGNPIPAHSVFDQLFDMNHISEYVSMDEWKLRLVQKAENENDYILSVLAQSLEDVELYLKDNSVYDSSRFEKALATHDLQRPVIGSEYFKRLIAL